MTLPLSGAISIEDINLELGRDASAPFDMNGTEERGLVGIPTGTYSWSDWWGKSVKFCTTFTAVSLSFGTEVGALPSVTGTINGSEYTLDKVTQKTDSGNFYLGLSYGGGSPSLAPSELLLEIDGKTFSTSSVGNGGAMSGVNWEIPQSELQGLSLVEGQEYTLCITLESTNPFGLIDHVVHRTTINPERNKDLSGGYIANEGVNGGGFGYYTPTISGHVWNSGSASNYKLPTLGLRGVNEPDLYIRSFYFNRDWTDTSSSSAIGLLTTTHPDSGTVTTASAEVRDAVYNQYRVGLLDLRSFHTFDGLYNASGAARLIFQGDKHYWKLFGGTSARPSSANHNLLVDKIKAISSPDNTQGSFEAVVILCANSATVEEVEDLVNHYRSQDGWTP